MPRPTMQRLETEARALVASKWRVGSGCRTVAFVPMDGVREIHGERSLPAGFAHPHASEEARALAEAGMILRVQVGSGVHGTSISGQDDRDEMGI